MDFKNIKKAEFFWIQTPTLYTTSIYKCGNQLDCPKGARVFFGFSEKTINSLPPHTKLGSVPMRFGTRPICDRNIWWAHNSMDKIYLPVTQTYGPNSYDECTLLFTKTESCFLISICTEAEEKKYRAQSAKQGLLYYMNQGREFGFVV